MLTFLPIPWRQIDDLGLQPAVHKETGEMGFNVVLGGYMSIKRVAHSVDANMWIRSDRNSVVTLSEAILRIFRDESERKDRQKARLMWLVEKYGVEGFKKAVIEEVESYDRGVKIDDAQPVPNGDFKRRELLGVHIQPQAGKVRVGILVPTGRLSAAECRELAQLAEKYSGGEVRLTVEQNVILPNVDESAVDDLLKEDCLKGDARLKVNPGFIEGNLVSCTGAQFCGLALIETKANAEALAKKLETLVTVDKPIRIHWTGWYVLCLGKVVHISVERPLSNRTPTPKTFTQPQQLWPSASRGYWFDGMPRTQGNRWQKRCCSRLQDFCRWQDWRRFPSFS